MGEILKSTYATKSEQLTQLQAGPISILTGYNLRKPAKPTSSDEHTKPHPPNLALRVPANYGDQIAKGRSQFSDGVSGSQRSEEGSEEHQKNDCPRDHSDHEKTLVGVVLLSCHFQCLRNEDLTENGRVLDQGESARSSSLKTPIRLPPNDVIERRNYSISYS